MYKQVIKRLLDILVSTLAIIILCLPMLIIGIVVKLDSRGPVLFKQKRVGKDGKLFTILKFRTMSFDAPNNVPTSMMNESVKWVTRVGRALRKSSLDELPQLFNIWIGQMSFIGPRPSLYNEYELIEARKKVGADRLRPGLSGLAQINGRDKLSMSEKVAYDGEYALRLSFPLDVKCFLGTVLAVFRFDEVSEGEISNEDKHISDK